MTCPNCNSDLVPTTHGFHPSYAPWHCNNCLRAWWQIELTDEVRAMWRPEHADFGWDDRSHIEEAIRIEEGTAQVRGACVLVSQLSLLSKDQLNELLTLELHPTFKAKVEEQL